MMVSAVLSVMTIITIKKNLQLIITIKITVTVMMITSYQYISY